MTLMLREECQLAGFYRLQVMRGEEIRSDTGWFRNLITDQGMVWVGQLPIAPSPSIGATLNTHCGVGIGTTAPAFTDTRLASPLAMNPPLPLSVQLPGTLAYVAGVTPYWSCIWTYQFGLGAVIGNISEVGVGNTASTDTNPQLFSRNLILDGMGNPTTIPVTALDVLIVTYELRYYIATGDNTYSIVIDGTLGPVTYTGTYRRMQIGTVPLFYYPVLGSPQGTATGQVESSAYTGFVLGPITGNPTYTQFDGIANFSYSSTAYLIGSGYAEFTTHIPLARANFVGGITGFSTQCNHGQYQFSISPFIPKTSAYVLTITWRVFWTRYP